MLDRVLGRCMKTVMMTTTTKSVLRASYSAINARSELVSSFKGVRRRDTQYRSVYLCDLTQQTHASASLRCSQASEVSCAAGRDEPREVTRVPSFGTGNDDFVTQTTLTYAPNSSLSVLYVRRGYISLSPKLDLIVYIYIYIFVS